MRLLRQRAVLKRFIGSDVDEYGNPSGASEDLDVYCFIQFRPFRSQESPGSDVEITDWVGYFPPGTPVSSSDRVLFEGRLFEVTRVGEARTPDKIHHIRCDLKEVGVALHSQS